MSANGGGPTKAVGLTEGSESEPIVRAWGPETENRVPKYVPDSTELHRTGLISLDAAGTNQPQMASQRQFSVRKPGFESP